MECWLWLEYDLLTDGATAFLASIGLSFHTVTIPEKASIIKFLGAHDR